MLLLSALFFKHLIVDFFWQPEYEWKNKGTLGHWGGIRHSLKHGIITGLIFLPLTIYAPLLGLIDAMIHYAIDWGKVNYAKYRNLTPNNPEYWYALGFDQYLHYLTYVGLVLWY